MDAIEKRGIEIDAITSGRTVRELSHDESSLFFDKSFTSMMEHLRPGSIAQRGRWTELSPSTVYKLLLKLTGKKRRRDDCEDCEEQE